MNTSTSTSSVCGYAWCHNKNPNHVERWGGGEVSANYSGPKSAEISCSPFVTVDSGGPYHDEIFVQVKTTKPGTNYAQNIDQGVGLFLTDQEARQLRDLLDTAIAHRAEIRGQVTR